MMKLIEDLGMRSLPSKARKRYGVYECTDCKIHFEARTENVKARKQGRCNSCASKLRAKKHGMRNHTLNNTINNMIQRCENPNVEFYKDYGGRGIYVADEWRNNREAFFTWALVNGWDEALSIDRIDVNKGYTPTNCRFVNKSIQAQNTRPLQVNNTSGYRGVHFNNSKQGWEANITVKGKRKYLGTFLSAELASEAYVQYVNENHLEHNYGYVAQAMSDLLDENKD